MTANGPLAATKGSPLARIHWIIGKSEIVEARCLLLATVVAGLPACAVNDTGVAGTNGRPGPLSRRPWSGTERAAAPPIHREQCVRLLQLAVVVV
jgi:hypothetical protein